MNTEGSRLMLLLGPHTVAKSSVSDSADDVIRTRANYRASASLERRQKLNALLIELTGKLYDMDNFK